MPSSNSAKKRMRLNAKQRLRNRARKSAMRNQMKRVVAALSDGDLDRARGEFQLATKKLDQAAAKNIIHKNAAARLKSRLARRVNALQPRSTASQ